MVDFNVEPKEANILDILEIYILKSLVKQKALYKNTEKPNSDKFSKEFNFQSTSIFETGLSGFHKMIVTFMKLCFPEQNPKIMLSTL